VESIDWPAVIELLSRVWPRLATAIPTSARLGARWHEMSTPFTALEAGRVVAHAGVLEVPLVLDGRAVLAAGVHAVCSAPEHRGRGLVRRVLEAALAHAHAYELTVLHANDAALYRKFGFRDVDQVAFVADAPRGAKAAPMRRLSDAAPDDVARVLAAFVGREPVSHVLGVGEAGPLFVMDEVLGCGGFRRLWYAEDLDAVVACDLDDAHVLQIYDIVARELPSIPEIVARVPGRVDAVELLFAPDRVGGRWKTRPLEPVDVFMVRGPFIDARELVLPPLARC
jgi:predicted N-acetyltransferase YhbS